MDLNTLASNLCFPKFPPWLGGIMNPTEKARNNPLRSPPIP